MHRPRPQRLIALIFYFFSGIYFLQAQIPPNDDLCDATLLTVGSSCNGMPNGNNTNAGLEIGEPLGLCFATPNSTVWYKFVGPSSGFVDISTDFAIGSNNDTEIALYGLPSGNCSTPTSLQEIACDQDNGITVNFNSIISTAPVIPGDTFYIQVSGWQGLAGSFCIEVNASPIPPPAQPNDTLCNAIPIVVGASCNGVPIGDNTFSTQQVYEPIGSCFGNDLASVWFSFVAPPSGIVSISTDFAIGTLVDTEIAVYALPGGDCNDMIDLVEIACDQDGGSTVMLNSFINGVNLNPATTYYIQVSGFGGAEGSFCVEVQALSQIPNDDVCNASLVPINGSIQTFSNVGATVQAGENNLGIIGGAGDNNVSWFQVDTVVQVSVWLKFLIPPSGTVNLDFCSSGGTTFDTQVALFETPDCQDFSQFVLKAWNDDVTGNCNSGSSIFASDLTASCLTPGDTAWVLVDGFLGEVGTFELILTEVLAPPINAVATIIPPDCPNINNGIIDLRIVGGSAPFNYSWNNGLSTEDLRDLPPGNYSVLITDNCDSTTTFSVSIVGAPSLLVNAGNDQATCGSNSIMLGGNPSAHGGKAFESKRAFGFNLDAGELMRHEVNRGNTPQVLGSFAGDIFAADFIDSQLFGLDDALDRLIVFDTATSLPSVIGNSPTLIGHNWSGLAYNQQNQTLYGLSTDGSNSFLYTINPSTGNAIPIYPVDRVVPIWLAIDTAGLAYTLDLVDNNLYSIDLQTGQSTQIGHIGFNAQFAQDADFDPETNQLYLASFTDVSPSSELRIADVSTGNTALLAPIPINGEVGGWAIAPEDKQPYLYTWSPPIGLSNPFSPNPMAVPIADTDYILTVADACGSVVQDTIKVLFEQGPTTNLEASSDDGSGMGGQAIAVTSGGLAPYNYSWSNGASTDTITGLAPGIYTVYITDALNCKVVDSVKVGSNSIDEWARAGLRHFNIYPNPNNGVFSLDISLLQASEISWKIYDLQAKLIRSAAPITGKELQQEISLEDVAAGIYIFELRTPKHKLYQKLMIE